jgi:predicted nucleic acid-binding protein
MEKRFYLDSNVFISFVREEIDSALNLRFVDSENFFAFCRKEKCVLILSGLFFMEVERVISLKKEDILSEFNRLKIGIELVEKKPLRKLVSKIIKETKIHFADAVHIAVACENKADAIITWNKKDFAKAQKFVPCFTPSEILDRI